jgi:hypothetical protein
MWPPRRDSHLSATATSARRAPQLTIRSVRRLSFYYLVDATRAGLTGFHESPPWISLVVAALVDVGPALVAHAEASVATE